MILCLGSWRNEVRTGKTFLKLTEKGIVSLLAAMVWPWKKHCFLLALSLSLFVPTGLITRGEDFHSQVN